MGGGQHAPQVYNYDVKDSPVPARRECSKEEERGVWFQIMDESGTEEHFMDGENRAEVYGALAPGRDACTPSFLLNRPV